MTAITLTRLKTKSRRRLKQPKDTSQLVSICLWLVFSAFYATMLFSAADAASVARGSVGLAGCAIHLWCDYVIHTLRQENEDEDFDASLAHKQELFVGRLRLPATVLLVLPFFIH